MWGVRDSESDIAEQILTERAKQEFLCDVTEREVADNGRICLVAIQKPECGTDAFVEEVVIEMAGVGRA